MRGLSLPKLLLEITSLYKLLLVPLLAVVGPAPWPIMTLPEPLIMLAPASSPKKELFEPVVLLKPVALPKKELLNCAFKLHEIFL